jgi:hypothetical protein
MPHSMNINAPKEKVWKTMLGEDTYRIWTEVFMPGSHYVGDWSKGSKILFLAPAETGTRLHKSPSFLFATISTGNSCIAPSAT